MTSTKFKVSIFEQIIIEIFGSQDGKIHDPILLKNISQKTKFHLRKLGEALQKEMKLIREQLKEIYDKYFDEVVGEDGKKARKIKEGMSEEDFVKEANELESIEVEIPHHDFQEDDFIDKVTGDIIAGKIYYNLLDKLIYEIEDIKI